MSDQDGNGRAHPTWGMPEQSHLQPPYAQSAVPPQQGYGAQPNYGAPPPGYYAPAKTNKGLIITLVSIIGVLVLAGIIVLVIWLSGGFGGSSHRTTGVASTGTAPSAVPPTLPTSRPSTAPSAGSITRDYMVGTWSTQCSTPGAESVTFSADGRAYNGKTGQSAVWTITGNNLTILAGGREIRQTLAYIDQNTISDGRQTVHRCG